MEDRVKQLNDISAVLEKSKLSLDSTLAELGWSKEYIAQEKGKNAAVCPVDDSHRIPSNSLDRHTVKCRMAREGIQQKDLCPSSHFYYKKSPSIVPIHIDEETYNGFKNLGKKSMNEVKQPNAPQTSEIALTPWYNADICDLMTDDDVVTMATQGLDSGQGTRSTYQERQPGHPEAQPDSSLERIRSIAEWQAIPGECHQLEIECIKEDVIRSWLMNKVPKTKFLSSVPSGDGPLVKFIMSCLKEPSVANPVGMKEQLADLLGEETTNFVLQLWKFLAISVVCHQNNISEVDRIAAENGAITKTGSASGPSTMTSTSSQGSREAIPIPMSRVDFDLNPAQRLAMYDYVIQTAKSRKRHQDSDDVTDAMNATDGEAGDNKGGQSGSAKSHVESLAELRDYKRRRQSYRAKNVHKTKRSAVEVMRDLIETQMKMLEEQLEEDGESGYSAK